jgi:arsenite methyltransferase
VELVREPEAGSENRRIFYTEEEISRVPMSVRMMARGVGNPIGFASLEPGEIVVDLGCGAGLDVIIAAHGVGTGGRVIGVDLAANMIKKAREALVEADLKAFDIDLLVGDVENLDLPDAFADVVISNAVVCMVPHKDKAFSEAFRVLKPGGRLAFADLVLAGDTDPGARERLRDAWQGGLGGAIPQEDYLGIVRKAGFEKIDVVSCDVLTADEIAGIAICPGKKFVTPADRHDLERIEGKVLSLKFLAQKPLF